MVTFSKLQNGNWGVRIDGDEHLRGLTAAGTRHVVTKRDGTTKEVTLAGIEVAAEKYTVCAIVETLPVRSYYRGRATRRSGEQASLSSQTRPYDLAAVFEEKVKRVFVGDDVSGYQPPLPTVAETQAAIETNQAQQDLSEVFRTLLAQPSNLTPESKL